MTVIRSEISAPKMLAAVRPATNPRLQSKIRNPKSKIRPAFTFVEVLFAVMILGIGFIMIAGVFPLGLGQTQLNNDETIGAALARNGVHYLESLPYSQIAAPPGPMLPDGIVHPFDAVLWDYVKGNLIQPENTRYAWVPFYRRGVDANGQPASSAQVIVVAVRARGSSQYDPAADLGNNSPLLPRAVDVTISANSNLNAPDTITIGGVGAAAVAPGTYVVMAQDQSGADPNYPGVNANGWVFKVGVNTSANNSGTTWELVSGNDLKSSGYKPTSGKAWVIGQAVDSLTGAFSGGAQDIAVYSSFIQLH